MAQGRLTRFVAATAILALGAAAEAAAPAASPALTAADFAVGALVGCGGAWLLDRDPVAGMLGVATAAAWFLGTLAGASSDAVAAVGSACLVAYRGPLLHLLLTELRAGRLGVLAAAAWLAAFLPLSVAGPATAAIAVLVVALALSRARPAAADRRQGLVAIALAAGGLAVVWWLAVGDLAGDTALLALTDAAVAAAGTIALTVAAGSWARQAAGALVVELGVDRGGRPVTEQLARALGDPALQVLYALPGLGWVDERGRPVAAPDGDLTRAVAPQGGEVVLVHGTAGPRDARLAEAAAGAAALSLDAARLEAEVRSRAADVRASRRRLLTVADAERRELEERLSDGPLARLRRAERLLGESSQNGTGPLRDELRAAMDELSALARGLYPPALTRADLAGALATLAERSPVPTALELSGDLRGLAEDTCATAWFVCCEALANVIRHAHASRASITVRAQAATLLVEIGDDGRGGATPTRGLRGLADRVEATGGTLAVTSPPGGPTTVRAVMPLG